MLAYPDASLRSVAAGARHGRHVLPLRCHGPTLPADGSGEGCAGVASEPLLFGVPALLVELQPFFDIFEPLLLRHGIGLSLLPLRSLARQVCSVRFIRLRHHGL
jgi:hypothetical protein